MDDKDRQIIAALQADGRLSNQELSERVNLSPSPCLRRLRMLEESKVIRGYTAIIDEKPTDCQSQRLCAYVCNVTAPKA
jgi:Lrp/AsnC family transcriptional regulator, leucine-responsive regulatory protein